MRKLAQPLTSYLLILLVTIPTLFFFTTVSVATAQAQAVTCSVTSNKAQVNQGETFRLTINFTDNNPHRFTYTFNTPEGFTPGEILPPTNPYTFEVIAPNQIFRSITVRPAVGGDFTGCSVNVANTTDSVSNECTFNTEPSDLQNMDNADGNLQINVTIVAGPTGTYKAAFKKSGDSSETVGETESGGRPSFNFTLDAPDERGVYTLDVTGTRTDNGARLDCNTVDGLLNRLVSIQSGRSPGVGETPPDRDTTGDLPENVRRVVNFAVSFGIGIAGGVAFLLLVYGGFKFIFSVGNPENVQQGREIITAAIIGLIVVVFSVFLLRLIGISILGLPI